MQLECVPHEQKKGVFIVLYDEKPWKEIHCAIFGKSPKLDANDREKFFQLEYEHAKRFSLRILSRKSISSYEFEKLLDSKLVSSQSSEKLLHEFQVLGYINDTDWISQFVKIQMQKKNGPKVIAKKLQSKGIPEEVFKEILEAVEEREPQQERIKEIIKTKYKKHSLSDSKERQKVIASLLRRGFEYASIFDSIAETMRS